MALQCERMYALKYLAGKTSAYEPPWRLLGTLGHSLLALHYGRKLKSPPKWMEPLLDRDVADVLMEESDGNVTIVQQILAVYDIYKRIYANESIEPIAVEQEFSATIGELDPGGPWPELDSQRVTGRVDLLCLVNGRLVIMDHKFSGGEYDKVRNEIQAKLTPLGRQNRYAMSLQSTLYTSLVHYHAKRMNLGIPEDVYPTFQLNRIKRRIPYDFDRPVIELSPLMIQETPRQVRGLLKKEAELLARMADGHKPVAGIGTACIGDYGPCDFYEICHSSSPSERQSRLRVLRE